MTKRKNNIIFILSVLAFPLALFLVFYVYVNINSVVMAFQTPNLDGTSNWVGFDNFGLFIKMITESGGILNIALKNSLIIYFINLCICMPLYIFFSYIIFRKFKGYSIIRAIVLIPQVISSMIMCLVFKNLASEVFPIIAENWFGIANFKPFSHDNALATCIFYMIWSSFGTSLLVYSNAMGDINPEILESAHIDGIDNMFLELWYIILPLIFPTMQTFLVVGFSSIFANDASLVTFFNTSAPSSTYTVGYYLTVVLIDSSKGSEFNMIAAGGLILSLVITPLTFLVKRLLDRLCPEVI